MKNFVTVFIIIIFGCFFSNLMAQQNDLEEQITVILKQYQVPGAAIALVKKDTVVWNGYFGKASLSESKVVTDNTLFGLGSISKTFLALGIMIAQDNILLDMHKPLKQLVPKLTFRNTFEESRPLRLIHLLEHTSGFDEAHFDIFARTNALTPFDTVINKSQSALTTRWQPGNYYSYNTLSYIVAASVLEMKANIPFETFMQNRIFVPLEMNRATYFPAEESNLATGYSDTSIEPFPNIPQWPAGSLSTTLEEMQRFTQLFLNDGRYQDVQVVHSSSIKAMETPESSLLAQQGVTFGYGKGLMQKFNGQHLFFGHNGSYGGFLSEFGYSKDADIGYVILINNRNASAALKAIKKLLLKPYVVENRETLNYNKTFTKELSDIEGAYQPTTANLEILYPFMRLADLQFIEKEKGKWMQKSIFGDAQELVRVSNYNFKYKDQPKASNSFKLNENENPVAWRDQL